MFIDPSKKIVSDAKQLRCFIDELERLRNTRLSVGYVGGFYDLLHPGHMKLLDEAKKRCDFLVVSVNADVQAKRKGSNRPIMSQDFRCISVANLQSVDAVLKSSALYNAEKGVYYTDPNDYLPLNADIAFFGTEYQTNFPKHRRLFAKEICFIDAELGCHTSDIIQRIFKPAI